MRRLTVLRWTAERLLRPEAPASAFDVNGPAGPGGPARSRRSAVQTFAIIASFLLATSCSTVTLVEAPATLKSMVEMKDESSVAQLTHGFWKLEAGSWRWTAKKFRAVLEAPPGAAERGAMFELHFTLLKEVIAGGDPLDLIATVNGMRLPRVAFGTPGPQVFWRVIPPEAMQTRPVVVEIAADHAMPKETDEHELSLIVSKIGLLPR